MPRIALALWLLICCLALGCTPAETTDGSSSGSEPGTAPAQEASESGSDAEAANGLSQWQEVYDEMVSELDLDSEQQEKLKQTFESQVQKLEAWYADKGKQLSKLNRQVMDAAKSRDLSALRSLTEQGKQLKAEIAELKTGFDTAILDTLGDEASLIWQAHRLAQRFQETFAELELTDDQQAKLATFASQAAIAAQNAKNPAAEGFIQMEKRFEEILTPEQKQEFESIKKKNRLRSLKTYFQFQKI